jgi:hypothetical protein
MSGCDVRKTRVRLVVQDMKELSANKRGKKRARAADDKPTSVRRRFHHHHVASGC